VAGKRSALEICADILRVARDGVKKSHIIYQANLNFNLGQKYLDQLTSSGLIHGPKGRDRAYVTTEKGMTFLKHFESLEELRCEVNAPP